MSSSLPTTKDDPLKLEVYSSEKEPVQGVFKELLFMSLNSMATPKEEAIQRELAIVQTRLLQRGKRKIIGHDREVLEQRQEFLLRQQLQR